MSSFAVTSLLPLPAAAPASQHPRVFCSVAGPECVENEPYFRNPKTATKTNAFPEDFATEATHQPALLTVFRRYIIITPGSSEIDVLLLRDHSSAAVTAGACGSGGGGGVVALSVDDKACCELSGACVMCDV